MARMSTGSAASTSKYASKAVGIHDLFSLIRRRIIIFVNAISYVQRLSSAASPTFCRQTIVLCCEDGTEVNQELDPRIHSCFVLKGRVRLIYLHCKRWFKHLSMIEITKSIKYHELWWLHMMTKNDSLQQLHCLSLTCSFQIFFHVSPFFVWKSSHYIPFHLKHVFLRLKPTEILPKNPRCWPCFWRVPAPARWHVSQGSPQNGGF